MKRWFALMMVVVALMPMSRWAQEASISGTLCAPEPSVEWDELVKDTDVLLAESRVEFASGSLAFSPGNTEPLRSLGLGWIDMDKRWREVEIPEGRQIIQFTANRMAGHLSATFTYMIDGSIDEFQLGKTAEAMDAYVVSGAVFSLSQIGC